MREAIVAYQEEDGTYIGRVVLVPPTKLFYLAMWLAGRMTDLGKIEDLIRGGGFPNPIRSIPNHRRFWGDEFHRVRDMEKLVFEDGEWVFSMTDVAPTGITVVSKSRIGSAPVVLIDDGDDVVVWFRSKGVPLAQVFEFMADNAIKIPHTIISDNTLRLTPEQYLAFNLRFELN